MANRGVVRIFAEKEKASLKGGMQKREAFLEKKLLMAHNNLSGSVAVLSRNNTEPVPFISSLTWKFHL